MGTRTLLDIVQDVLASIDGDEVNSIFDTVESEKVARIVRDSYTTIVVSLNNAPETKGLYTLTAEPTMGPVVMSLPVGLQTLEWLKYNCEETADSGKLNYRDLVFLPIDEFVSLSLMTPKDDTNTSTLNLSLFGSNIKLLYRTNKHPDYYTTLDDKYLVFDSLDTSIQSSLEESYTLAYGKRNLTFSMEDSFVIPLDPNLTHLLVQESKSQASIEERQTENPKAEKRARKAWIRTKEDNQGISRTSYFDQFPDYGRK